MLRPTSMLMCMLSQRTPVRIASDITSYRSAQAPGLIAPGPHGYQLRLRASRFLYFDEIAGVMQQDGRVVPMYQDKYFAYAWDDAKHMYDSMKRMRIPVLCGSTVPLAQRDRCHRALLHEEVIIGYSDQSGDRVLHHLWSR